MAATRPGPEVSDRVATKETAAVPPPVVKSISAADIFKNHAIRSKKRPAVAALVEKPPLARSVLKKVRYADIESSSTPLKAGKHKGKGQSSVHSAAAPFNDAAASYREQLYENTTAKLDDTLTQLLDELHQCDLVIPEPPTATSGPNVPPAVKITLAEKHDRITKQLIQPIGSMAVKRVPTGEQAQKITRIGEMVLRFQTRYEEDMQLIQKLEKQWERVVGEIWKLGVDSLGEGAMSSLLLKDEVREYPPAKTARDDEAALFDIEPRPAKQKRVIRRPKPSELPKFLFAPSAYHEVLPVPKQLSQEEVKELERMVDAMGGPQLEELLKIDREQLQWWYKKTRQVAMAFGDD